MSAKHRHQPLKPQPLASELKDEIGHQGGLSRQECLTFSRRDAADVLGISTRTVDRLVDAGELRYVGSTHRLSKQAVLSLVHSASRKKVA